MSVNSPKGKFTFTVSGVGDLNYRAAVDAKFVVATSKLGLDFKDGAQLGAGAVLAGTPKAKHRGI